MKRPTLGKGGDYISEKLRVMLTSEGTYPFHQGGVSTWCDILVNKMPEYEFVLYSVIMNPYVTQKYTLPANTELIKVPLWGTEEPCESLSIPFSQVFISKKRTTTEVIKKQFLPLFTELISEFTSEKKDSEHLGDILLKMHLFFEDYEYKVTFKSQLVWETFKTQVLGLSELEESGFDEPNIFSLIQSLGWVYRFLNVVNTPIPKVDVTHSAAAAFCGIPCVLAKLKNKTPYILTEHGVYLREQYFSLSQRGYISYMNTFLIRMIQSVVELNYHFADQVSPVCNYNSRWEKEFGVLEKNLKVIYNGVDSAVFNPGLVVRKPNKSPIIVTVARIDPLKDIKTLIRSAELVLKEMPEVTFHVYGSVSVPKYFDECVELIKNLKLEKKFILKGHTSDVPSAYREGDIIVLSSISEAFPYSVVEAMLIGKPIVTTDVGGIREALGDSGVLVDPSDFLNMSKQIIRLLKDSELRAELAQEARNRALNYFTLDRVLKLYSDSYIALAASRDALGAEALILLRIQLALDKAYAFKAVGYYSEAEAQFSSVFELYPKPEILLEIMNQLKEISALVGQKDLSDLYSDKRMALQILFELAS